MRSSWRRRASKPCSASSADLSCAWVSCSSSWVSSISRRDAPMVWACSTDRSARSKTCLTCASSASTAPWRASVCSSPRAASACADSHWASSPSNWVSWRSIGLSALGAGLELVATAGRARRLRRPPSAAWCRSCARAPRAAGRPRPTSCRSAEARFRCSVALSSAPWRCSSSWPSRRIRSSSSSSWRGALSSARTDPSTASSRRSAAADRGGHLGDRVGDPLGLLGLRRELA